MHDSTEIYAAAAALSIQVSKTIKDMRRDMKPVAGKFLYEETKWLSVLIMRANIAHGQSKAPHFNELLEHLELIKFSLRTEHEVRNIPHNHFADCLPLIASVGKQAIAMRNHFAPEPSPVA